MLVSPYSDSLVAVETWGRTETGFALAETVAWWKQSLQVAVIVRTAEDVDREQIHEPFQPVLAGPVVVAAAVVVAREKRQHQVAHR